MSSFFVFQVVTTFGCTFPSSEIIGPWSPSSVKRKRTDSVEEVRHLRSCVSNGTSECRKPSSQKVHKYYRCEWNKCSTMKLQMEHWWRPWILKKLESLFCPAVIHLRFFLTRAKSLKSLRLLLPGLYISHSNLCPCDSHDFHSLSGHGWYDRSVDWPLLWSKCL